MKGTTQYFSHDYNAAADLKVEAMISDFGIAGYGMYWYIIERLYQEETHRIDRKPYILKGFAKQMSTDVEQVSTFIEKCIGEYELFVAVNGSFYSDRVLRQIAKREKISAQKSIAGKASADARKRLTDVEQVLTDD